MRKLIPVFVLVLLLCVGCEKNNVTVCIIDSGCNIESTSGYNYLDNNSDISDNTSHGSEIYSLFRTIDTKSDVYCLKCFDEKIDYNAQVIIQAIQDATDKYQADVILMSFASDEYNEELLNALDDAYNKNAILIAASGNLDLAVSTRAVNYPAGYDCVIGVGAVDLDENGNPKSSLWYHKGEEVFVVAQGQYLDKKGTSYAAARVAGYVANVLRENPNINEEKLKKILKEKAIDLGEDGYDTTYGYGYLNTDN